MPFECIWEMVYIPSMLLFMRLYWVLKHSVLKAVLTRKCTIYCKRLLSKELLKQKLRRFIYH